MLSQIATDAPALVTVGRRSEGDPHEPASARVHYRALPLLTDRVDEFQEQLPEERPRFASGVAKSLGDLLDLESIDRILADQDLRHPQVSMVRNGASRPATAYTNAGIPNYRGTDPLGLNPALLGRELADGASLILPDLSSCWRPVSDFCRRLSYEVGRPAGAGAMLTPAGAQGLRHHYDWYSIFAVQLVGRKTWQLYRPAWSLPLERLDQAWRGGRFLSAEDRRRLQTGEPDLVVELAAGDVLWLPRGWIHNVFAGTEASLHMTIHLHGLNDGGLVDALRELLAKDERFRQALPTGFTRCPELAGSTAEQFVARVTERIAIVEPERLARVVVDRMGRSWPPPRYQPVLELLLTDQELDRYDGLTPQREAALAIKQGIGGRLEIETSCRKLVLERPVAQLFGAALIADGGHLIPLEEFRAVLGDRTVEVVRQLVGAGVATLARR